MADLEAVSVEPPSSTYALGARRAALFPPRRSVAARQHSSSAAAAQQHSSAAAQQRGGEGLREGRHWSRRQRSRARRRACGRGATASARTEDSRAENRRGGTRVEGPPSGLRASNLRNRSQPWVEALVATIAYDVAPCRVRRGAVDRIAEAERDRRDAVRRIQQACGASCAACPAAQTGRQRERSQRSRCFPTRLITCRMLRYSIVGTSRTCLPYVIWRVIYYRERKKER